MKKKTGILLSQAILEWVEWGKCGHYKESTVYSYNYAANKFLSEIGDKDVKDVMSTDFVQYYEKLKKAGYSDSTLLLYMMALRELWKYLYFRFYVKMDWKVIPYPRKLDKENHISIKDEEVQKIIDSIKAYTHVYGSLGYLRDTLIVLLLDNTGMRISELVSLNIDDIILEDKRAIVTTRKNRRLRNVFWDNKTQDVLITYLHERARVAEDSALFISFANKKDPYTRLSVRSVQRLVKKYKDKAGIERKITPHSFRHGFGTRAVSNGIEISHLQKLMGHSNPASTFVYTQLDHTKLRKEYDRVFREKKDLSTG